MTPRARNKFGNVKTWIYASKKEARRAAELELLQKIGVISELRMQVKYELLPKQGTERAAAYIADFVFIEDGKLVVEDTKGHRTRDYILKRKMMRYIHGIQIREV